MEDIDWACIHECVDVDIAATLFCKMLNVVIDKHAPFTKVKLYDNAPRWFTLDYLSHVNEREFLMRKHKKCPCNVHLAQFIEAKTRTKQLRISLQKSYFEEALNSANSVKKK